MEPPKELTWEEYLDALGKIKQTVDDEKTKELIEGLEKGVRASMEDGQKMDAKRFIEGVWKNFPEAMVEACAEALAKSLLSLGILACGALLIFAKGKFDSD